MNVSSTSFYRSAFYLTAKTQTESNEQDFSFIEEYSNAQKKLIKPNNSNNVLEEIPSNHNVRNATFEEISEISLKLYEAGEISLLDHSILSFDWERAADYFRQNLKVHVKSDLNLTPTNIEGRRDWIAEFEARMNRDFKHNNLLGYENNKKIYNILKKLDRQ